MFGLGELRRRVEALETAARVKELKAAAKVGDNADYFVYLYGPTLAKITGISDEGLTVEVVIRDRVPWQQVRSIKPAEAANAPETPQEILP